MSSAFADIERLVSEVVDDVYGETVRITGMKPGAGDYGAQAEDNGRPFFDVTAIVDFNPVAVAVTDEGQFDGQQPFVAAQKAHVSIDTALLDWAPRRGDKISLTSRSPVEHFILHREPDEDGLGRIVCVCVPA
jgi:hypothetical protein